MKNFFFHFCDKKWQILAPLALCYVDTSVCESQASKNFSLPDSPEPPRSEKRNNVESVQGISLPCASFREEFNRVRQSSRCNPVSKVLPWRTFFSLVFFRRKLVCYVRHGLVHWWAFPDLGFSFCWAWKYHICRRYFTPSLCLTILPFWEKI